MLNEPKRGPGRPRKHPLPDLNPPGREEVEGRVIGRLRPLNPRIITVAVPGREHPINVFVRSSDNFIRGMPVKAFRDTGPGTTTHWFLQGPLPRFKGKY